MAIAVMWVIIVISLLANVFAIPPVAVLAAAVSAVIIGWLHQLAANVSVIPPVVALVLKANVAMIIRVARVLSAALLVKRAQLVIGLIIKKCRNVSLTLAVNAVLILLAVIVWNSRLERKIAVPKVLLVTPTPVSALLLSKIVPKLLPGIRYGLPVSILVANLFAINHLILANL